MRTIEIAINQANLAEVLAVVAVAGITGTIDADAQLSWESPGCRLHTERSEAEVLEAVWAGLADFRWIQSPGETYEGLFSANAVHGGTVILGMNPFVGLRNPNKAGLLKNFSAKTTAENIHGNLRDGLGTCPASLEELFGRVARIGSTWSYDARSVGHALDVGYSTDAEKSTKSNPMYVAVDMSSVMALSCFLPAHALISGNAAISYFLWDARSPVSLLPLLFTGLVEGIPARKYTVIRRSKAYGTGRSYRYWPPAYLEAQY